MKKALPLIPFIAIIASNTAVAAPNSKGFYIGAGKGSTKYTHSPIGENNDEPDKQEYKQTNSNGSLKGQIGYRFSKVGGIELSFIKYGEVQSKVTQRSGAFSFWGTTYSWDNSYQYKQQVKSAAISANLGYTFSNGIRPFAIIGVSRVSLARSTYINSTKSYTDTDTKLGLRFGYGLEFAPKALRFVSFRLAYEGDTFIHETTNNDYVAGFSTVHFGINIEL